MDRRRILLIVAAAVAALGTGLVFLYVRGADDRAQEAVQKVPVLEVVQQINPGETLASAQTAGKIALVDVPADQKLLNSQTEISDAMKDEVALTTLYPQEQILAAKFGDEADAVSTLQTPKGMLASAVNLTDPGRVAGFVNPGSKVSIYFTMNDQSFTRLLLPDVQVLGVGNTTPTQSTTTTDADGNPVTTEQLPRTLMTLALSPADTQRVIFAAANGELSFALRTSKSDTGSASDVTTIRTLFQGQ